jgi:hypothetical protein
VSSIPNYPRTTCGYASIAHQRAGRVVPRWSPITSSDATQDVHALRSPAWWHRIIKLGATLQLLPAVRPSASRQQVQGKLDDLQPPHLVLGRSRAAGGCAGGWRAGVADAVLAFLAFGRADGATAPGRRSWPGVLVGRQVRRIPSRSANCRWVAGCGHSSRRSAVSPSASPSGSLPCNLGDPCTVADLAAGPDGAPGSMP